MNSSETYEEKENTSCSCVTFDNKGCIFENICPDYIGKPSTFNRACLTLHQSNYIFLKRKNNGK